MLNVPEEAKEAVCIAHPEIEPRLTPTELFVVWSVKVLGNWKAIVSTNVIDHTIWEVTHNGDTGETYVDRYTKVSNIVVN
jgi:hypothetical protein